MSALSALSAPRKKNETVFFLPLQPALSLFSSPALHHAHALQDHPPAADLWRHTRKHKAIPGPQPVGLQKCKPTALEGVLNGGAAHRLHPRPFSL